MGQKPHHRNAMTIFLGGGTLRVPYNSLFYWCFERLSLEQKLQLLKIIPKGGFLASSLNPALAICSTLCEENLLEIHYRTGASLR